MQRQAQDDASSDACPAIARQASEVEQQLNRPTNSKECQPGDLTAVKQQYGCETGEAIAEEALTIEVKSTG
jgi:hypothetical protein